MSHTDMVSDDSSHIGGHGAGVMASRQGAPLTFPSVREASEAVSQRAVVVVERRSLPRFYD